MSSDMADRQANTIGDILVNMHIANERQESIVKYYISWYESRGISEKPKTYIALKAILHYYQEQNKDKPK